MANTEKEETVLPRIGHEETAFSHVPEHGFSLFLARRTKIIHFVRHAEGEHNAANYEFGDDTPNIFSTEGSWQYQDARLTDRGIKQCITARKTLLGGVNPQLVIVSPFTRTLQTAHIMFGGSSLPFMVHYKCRERAGKFTCDKLRSKTEIMADMKPIYEHTNDSIDFESFGFEMEEDELWEEERESSEHVIQRGVDMMKWLATRPESEIAVVTHSSFLKHLFRAFGHTTVEQDKEEMHRLAGNAEIRSICLASHKGFYPPGEWTDTDDFVPEHQSFRKFRWAPSIESISDMHTELRPSKA